MTASRLVTIWCDGDHAVTGSEPCAQWIAHEPTAAEARKVARSGGWVRRNGRDLSPHCAAREAATKPSGSDTDRQENRP